MAVVIRLTRQGRRKSPFYRIVAQDKREKRDGKFLEILGTHNPKAESQATVLHTERIRYWLKQGALPSAIVAKLIRTDMVPQERQSPTS